MMTGKENSAMTILMDFAKPCKGKLIGSVVLAVLGALCGIIPYIAVSRGIIMICHEDYAFSKLAFLALIAFAGYLGQVWFGTFSTMKSHESAFIILRNIRMAITEKLSRVPMGTILDTPSGKFKTIIVDTVEKLELPLAHMVPELTANILIPVLMLVYLFGLDWRLALISLVTIPVGAFCYMGMMKDYEKRYARVLAAGKNMDAATVEYIGGIEVVKTFNQGERSYKKYADAVAENETAKVTWFKQTNGYYVMGLSILTATLVGVLPLGSWLFINGRVEAGTLITCIILALGLVKPLIQALQYTDSLAMVDSTVKEVGNLLDEPELVRPTERAVLADADVSFDHVTFRYKETEVLHGISFDCAKNGMTAIVGPSGSGKSTIARLIASFWEAESGCVRIGGVDVRSIPLPQIMELVSYAFMLRSRGRKSLDLCGFQNGKLNRQGKDTFSLKIPVLLHNKSTAKELKRYGSFQSGAKHWLHRNEQPPLTKQGADPKGKRAALSNAVASRRLGLHPKGLIPYQPGANRRYPGSGAGTGTRRVYRPFKRTRRERTPAGCRLCDL